MKIAILGAAGRMGQMIASIAPEKGCEVVSRVDVKEGFEKTWSNEVEGIIDFSYHTAVPAAIGRAVREGKPYVLGTTGLSEAEQRAVNDAAKAIPVVQSGNYSLGINLLLDFVEKASKSLGSGYDIEVVEMHHRHKKDAPSGTALMLAKSAAKGREVDFEDSAIYGREGECGERKVDEIAIHALRGGGVVGDHTVVFAGETERIEFVHRAQSRAAFAEGAIAALIWAKGKKPGLYSMRDVLGLV